MGKAPEILFAIGITALAIVNMDSVVDPSAIKMLSFVAIASLVMGALVSLDLSNGQKIVRAYMIAMSVAMMFEQSLWGTPALILNAIAVVIGLML